MPLNGPTPHQKLSHYHQKPAGGKAPQQHDAVLCEPAGFSPQVLHRVGSASMLPQEATGEHLPTCHQDMGGAKG